MMIRPNYIIAIEQSTWYFSVVFVSIKYSIFQCMFLTIKYLIISIFRVKKGQNQEILGTIWLNVSTYKFYPLPFSQYSSFTEFWSLTQQWHKYVMNNNENKKISIRRIPTFKKALKYWVIYYYKHSVEILSTFKLLLIWLIWSLSVLHIWFSIYLVLWFRSSATAH